MRFCFFIVVCTFTTLCLAGCRSETSGASGGDSSFSLEDSAGITIAHSLERRLPKTSLARTISDSDLRWATDGSSAPGGPFFRIQGLRQLPDGRVAVVDAGSRELHFLDPNGEFLFSLGRRGQGPGEFENPSLVPSLASDSSFIWDSRFRRFQVFANDGSTRQVSTPSSWPLGAGVRPPLGLVAGDALVRVTRVFTPEYSATPGVKTNPVAFWLIDLLADSVVHLGEFSIQEEFIQRPIGRPPQGTAVPFSPIPCATVAKNSVLVSDGLHPEIHEFDLDGRLVRILRIHRDPVRVTPDLLDSLLHARYTPEAIPYVKRAFDAMPIPEVVPSFDRLIGDLVGWIWARAFHWDPAVPKEWIGFDDTGQIRTILRVPANLVVGWFDHRHLVGVWTDSLGVESVRQYTLPRS